MMVVPPVFPKQIFTCPNPARQTTDQSAPAEILTMPERGTARHIKPMNKMSIISNSNTILMGCIF